MQQNLLPDVWTNPAIGMVVVDTDGKILRVNKAFSSMIGYNEYELIQHTIWDLTAADDVTPSKARFNELQNGVIPHYTIEKRYIKKDNSMAWVRLIVTPLSINNAIHSGMYIGFSENITTRKNYEQELAIAYEQAKLYAADLVEEVKRRKELSEELQSFLYIAAHDIQEPIRTAANYFQLFESKVPDIIKADEEAADAAAVVTDNLRWATQLIGSLLRYSRIQQDDIDLVNACELIDVVKHALTLLIEEKHAIIKIDCDCNLSVIINQINAQRILQNLVQNALKYSTTPEITITCREDGNYVMFSVADNGIGIDARYHDLIFQPFKRLVKTPDGTGIGLAECKRIVEIYGGHIWLESELGEGSKFYFTLPLGMS